MSLFNTFTYQGHHILSDAGVVPVGTTIFKADQSIVLEEEFKVEANKAFEAYIEPCLPGNWIYEYHIKDHLGNNRVLYSDRNNNGSIDASEIIQQSHLYPYGAQMTGTWDNTLKHDYQYKRLGGERQQDFGLDWDLHEFRSFDIYKSYWVQADPLSELAPNWTPYRMGFGNPISFTDPLGLFESRAAAEEYAKEHGIKTGIFRSNRIVRQSDGSFAIQNKKAGTSIADDAEFGVMLSALIRPNDIIADNSTIFKIDITTRSGDSFLDIKHDRMSPGFPIGIGGSSGFSIAGTFGRLVSNPVLKSTLPSWKKVVIDINHIASGHMVGGARVSQLKSLFPSNMNVQQVEKVIRQAYKNVAKKVRTQGDRVLLRGETESGLKIEMWLNRTTKTIETAYPIR